MMIQGHLNKENCEQLIRSMEVTKAPDEDVKGAGAVEKDESIFLFLVEGMKGLLKETPREVNPRDGMKGVQREHQAPRRGRGRGRGSKGRKH